MDRDLFLEQVKGPSPIQSRTSGCASSLAEPGLDTTLVASFALQKMNASAYKASEQLFDRSDPNLSWTCDERLRTT